MCAMLEINRNVQLQELGWRLLLQVRLPALILHMALKNVNPYNINPCHAVIHVDQIGYQFIVIP